MNIQNTILQASKVLKNNNINSHILDAEILLANVMGVEKNFIITNSNMKISEQITKKYSFAINRRINSEPVAYIVGKKEFWSEDFFVNRSTLVPRPETEILIYKIIKLFKNKRVNILDIGTGSGCILLSILKELNLSRGTGIDISHKAIKVAKRNAKKLKLHHRSNFRHADLEKFNLEKYDIIVSNPPYIPTGNIKNLSNDITNYEPIRALDGGADGLDLIKKVIYKSNKLLKKNNILALEIGNNQYKNVSSILKQQGYREISRECDYNNNIRCILSTKVSFY